MVFNGSGEVLCNLCLTSWQPFLTQVNNVNWVQDMDTKTATARFGYVVTFSHTINTDRIISCHARLTHKVKNYHHTVYENYQNLHILLIICFFVFLYRLLDSLVVECRLWVREFPGSIPSQGPRHTKDVIKMVPVVPLFSAQHWKGKYWLFLKN